MSKFFPSNTSHNNSILESLSIEVANLKNELLVDEKSVSFWINQINEKLKTSDVTSVQNIVGDYVNYISYGDLYSFWFSGVTTGDFALPAQENQALMFITNNELPILNKYQGEPFYIGAYALQPSFISTVEVIIKVEQAGMSVFSPGKSTVINSGAVLACQFMLILGDV